MMYTTMCSDEYGKVYEISVNYPPTHQGSPLITNAWTEPKK